MYIPAREGGIVVFMRTKRLNHSVYCHQYHIVWGTKYRRKYLKPYVAREFESKLYFLINTKYPALYIQSLSALNDHIHLQIEIPPSISVSNTVKRLKWHTSIHLKRKFPFIKKIYIQGNIWSVGFFSSTIGLNETQIKKYIEYQGKQDKPQNQSLFS